MEKIRVIAAILSLITFGAGAPAARAYYEVPEPDSESGVRTEDASNTDTENVAVGEAEEGDENGDAESIWADATPQMPAVTGAAPVTAVDADTLENEGIDRLWLGYFMIFHGPSVGSPSSSQPDPRGNTDSGVPLLTRNYLTLGFNLNERVSVSATGTWHWKPVRGQELSLKDPYALIGVDRLVAVGDVSLYADARVHFAVTNESREADLMTGIQTFQILSWTPQQGRLTLGMYGSARYNVYGDEGAGEDWELYLAPNASYQVSGKVALTLLYEMGMSHVYGDKPFEFVNDGTDLEPGLSWQVTPNFSFNPYLNLYTGSRVTLNSTSVGFTLSWNLL